MVKKRNPASCKSMEEINELYEQGIAHNGDGIIVQPNIVEMTMGHTTIKIPMKTFRMFAEWYLTDQVIKEDY